LTIGDPLANRQLCKALAISRSFCHWPVFSRIFNTTGTR